MKVLSVCRKCAREAKRDKLLIALSVSFAPFFVFLYWLTFPSFIPSYGVAVLSEDTPSALASGVAVDGARELTARLAAQMDASGRAMLHVERVSDRRAALRQIADRKVSALVVIGPRFSEAIAAARDDREAVSPAPVITFVGDLSSPTYAVAAVLANAALDGFVRSTLGAPSLVAVHEEPMGGSGVRSDFEMAVPGILVFAVIMLVFQTAMWVTREAESGTLRRLRMTSMTAWDLLGGTSIVLVAIGIASVVVTFLTAIAFGFHSQGPMWLAVVVGAVTTVSIIGVGLMVAAFCRTVTQAFVVANFPLGLLMFFSGAMLPVPRPTLVTVAGRAVAIWDLLPPTHAVIALNKVLTLGAGLGEVWFELTALVVLSSAYGLIGVGLFTRLRMRAA
ncbi:MAG TPA: ABC transporter permease [Vicinamibacterales bacterium]|jgi:ABC-2 type transport system permease protein